MLVMDQETSRLDVEADQESYDGATSESASLMFTTQAMELCHIPRFSSYDMIHTVSEKMQGSACKPLFEHDLRRLLSSYACLLEYVEEYT